MYQLIVKCNFRLSQKRRVGFEPSGDGAGVSDSLSHGRVAVGVSVANEVDAPKLTSSVGPTDLNLKGGSRSGVISFVVTAPTYALIGIIYLYLA